MFILHLILVACIITISILGTSLWKDLPKKHKAIIKTKLISGIIPTVVTIAIALALVWAMFLAPAEICM